jgi:hypothetical protein
MGEYADMFIDGTVCSQCGVFVGGDGIPTLCGDCRKANGLQKKRRKRKKKNKKTTAVAVETKGIERRSPKQFGGGF